MATMVHFNWLGLLVMVLFWLMVLNVFYQCGKVAAQ